MLRTFTRRFLLAVVAVSCCGAALATGPDRLVLLPVQDRVGDPGLSATVLQVVREELAGRFVLTHPRTVRDGLRAGRIRDAGATTPSRLAGLALELDTNRFLSITIHQAVDGAIPVIALSGQSFEAGKTRLEWAGFRSASGLDERKMLGLGVVDNLEDLARRTTRRLMQDFFNPQAGLEGRLRIPPPAEGTYLRSMLNTRTMSKMAVLPFDSVVERRPQVAAEMATAALMAVLHRKGVPLTHPGIVDETLRRRYEQRYGGLDELSRAALKIGGGARWFVTGTVETFEMKGGIEPVPWLSLGVRVVNVESGQIFWIGGLERTGEEEENVFGLDRVHSPGELLDGMLDAISAGFLRTVEVERDGSK